MPEMKCEGCGGMTFELVHDEWMKRTFRFVENGQLRMCSSCGYKYLVCKHCQGNYTRVHPGLESWEVNHECPSCGYKDPDVDFYISTT